MKKINNIINNKKSIYGENNYSSLIKKLYFLNY